MTKRKTTPLRLSSTAATSRGARLENQDSLFFSDPRGLYLVADGVGGMPDGDVASQSAIAHGSRVANRGDYEGWIHRIVHEAQQGVKLKGGRMGTTLVAAVFDLEAHRLYVANAGDSRCYRLRNRRELLQLTDDQTYMGGLMGGLFSHNVKEASAPAFYTFTIQRGDTVMLCTDGVHGSAYRGDGLDKEEISSRMSYGNADAMVKAAVRFSNTYDNATAIIVRVK